MLENKLANKKLFNNINKNIINHNECILQMDRLYQKLEYKENIEINELNEKINFLTKRIIYKDNEIEKLKHNTYDNNIEFGDDIESLYIQEKIDIISMKKQIKYYEYQLYGVINFFNKNNIKGLNDLANKINDYNYIKSQKSNIYNISSSIYYNENSNLLINKIDNISKLIENNENKMVEINKGFKNLETDIKTFSNKINMIKNKIVKLKPGTTITINGIKKVFKRKNEFINNIKQMEEEFNEYYNDKILWAKSIIGNKYSNNEIIKLLDIYNKLCKEYISSGSDDEFSVIGNKLENNKVNEYNILCELGNKFISKNITDKSQIKDFIKNNKKLLKHYDANKENKQNRFISTCKRLYLLSQKVNVNNIVKSNCITSIRDISNNDFDILLKLLEKL